MDRGEMTQDEPLPAGDFSRWLAGMQRALRGEADAEVPCGGCTACCTSAQFVHIAPDETAALAHIPAPLLFPAPRLPAGNVLLGYDEQGRCPMLGETGCTIYAHRPRACRTYDCRVFPAAGLDPGDDGKPAIARQARRWQFTLPTDDDRVAQAAVRAAAGYAHDRRAALPVEARPVTATQQAVLAIRLHPAFLRHDEPTGRVALRAEPGAEAVHDALVELPTRRAPGAAPRPPERRRARRRPR